MKCTVKQNEQGEVTLVSNFDDSGEVLVIETLPIHKNIWVDNYLDEVVVEEENFRISEDLIGEETFHLVAYPIIHCKEI